MVPHFRTNSDMPFFQPFYVIQEFHITQYIQNWILEKYKLWVISISEMTYHHVFQSMLPLFLFFQQFRQ